jgi:hypothetical protein
VCVLLGLVLGWAPWLIHGPHPSKFSVIYMHGPVAVWSFYLSRMLIGFWIGISVWPRPWYLRGPLCGFLALLPVTFVALANPNCGFT